MRFVDSDQVASLKVGRLVEVLSGVASCHTYGEVNGSWQVNK